MFEFLFSIFGEFLLQIVVETFFELGLHSLAEPFRRKRNPWMAATGYAIFGALFGALSLLLFPAHLVLNHLGQLSNLLLVPVAAGLGMSALGAWRERRGQDALRIDSFSYGYLFALAFALVRFQFAN
ncbi:hypothetical protein SAMN05216303_101818 [Rhodoferax sp. OV413]|uniref:hypothetical protein n=1 Tax=Rhodoferax sp. OV413 TaxID=1855285 RepID=UPI000891CF37|nr:hypothetical protein [Rhodoferax sp. OV413]SDO21064.1 hypothetical protein SAMN05216303_101818 [Rhodoferax sp. OV413]